MRFRNFFKSFTLLACGLVAVTWFYGLPYQMGLLAATDPLGRANMAGVVMTTGGAASGPALAALLSNRSGHTAIGIFAASCYLLALVLVLASVIQMSRSGSAAKARRGKLQVV